MTRLRSLVAGAFALIAGAAFGAACPPHAFTAPADVRIKGDSVLIVTHATAFHDARYASKPGIDEAVRYAKAHAIPVVYLQATFAFRFVESAADLEESPLHGQ